MERDDVPVSSKQTNKKSICSKCKQIQSVSNLRNFYCGHSVCELCLIDSQSIQPNNSQPVSIRVNPPTQCPLPSCSKNMECPSLNFGYVKRKSMPNPFVQSNKELNINFCNEHQKEGLLFCTSCSKVICKSCAEDLPVEAHLNKKCNSNTNQLQQYQTTFSLWKFKFNNKMLKIFNIFASIQNFEADYESLAIIRVFIKMEIFRRKKILIEAFESYQRNKKYPTGVLVRNMAKIQYLLENSQIHTIEQNIALEAKALHGVTRNLITNYIESYSNQLPNLHEVECSGTNFSRFFCKNFLWGQFSKFFLGESRV